MCITFLSIGYHEGYRLVLVCNRDEDIFRPTLNANWWENEPILGGEQFFFFVLNYFSLELAKDLEKNGSQFAVSKDGRMAIITNYREMDSKVYESSRGHIVVDYLR